MRYSDYLDGVRDLNDRAHRPQVLTVSDAGHVLSGFLAGFGLRRPVITLDPRHGGAWVVPGLEPWWTRPGRPAVPVDELRRDEMGRINYILAAVFREADRADDLPRLTTLRGQRLALLLDRIRR